MATGSSVNGFLYCSMQHREICFGQPIVQPIGILVNPLILHIILNCRIEKKNGNQVYQNPNIEVFFTKNTTEIQILNHK